MMWQTNWREVVNRPQSRGNVIPTWEIGQEQGNPQDVARFARVGYEKNSLIYSCIKEKATSFASLSPQVVRRDGTVMRDHRVVQLLENPNPYQDGRQFAKTLKTHLESAGQVFIQMHEVSPDPQRRRDFAGFPVQELELIRPDYVSIEPGATPSRDVFVITVAGKVVRRVPRSQMIHILEPSLTNDYHGLSKVALLVREGSIDLSMSDYELAFFRNAGVPMGVLSVKGRTTPEQTTEIKSNFRKAYNSVKGFFDLLVLNADTSTYTQLGMKNADMEMDSTRYHVESRICSVFGVPGVIVGARFAMQGGGTTTTYEDAEHAFWAETMVPEILDIGAAWTMHLLPRFATTRDRGATVTYDFTIVRALQEDRSRKMREVVRMINTGAFTVNQALTLVGMDAIDGGDFYIRTGNQVTVVREADGTETIVMQPSPGGANPDNPLEGAARLRVPVAGGVRDDWGPEDAVYDESGAAVAEALSIFRGRQ